MQELISAIKQNDIPKMHAILAEDKNLISQIITQEYTFSFL